MNPIVIVGAGGLAREVYALIKQINEVTPCWDVLGFIDIENHGEIVVDECRILGDDDYVLSQFDAIHVVIGLGYPAMRRKIYCRYKSHPGITFPNLIHPSVIISEKDVAMGDGNIICALSWISTSVTIGNANLISAHSIVAHDVIISDFCVLNPGANLSGNVKLENDCLIGANATVHQGVKLKERTILGLGSALTRHTKAASTYVGNPARKLF